MTLALTNTFTFPRFDFARFASIRSLLALIVCSCLMVVTTACTADQVTTTLEDAVDAAILAAPLVEIAANVPAPLQATISAYLNGVEACLASAQTALDTPGSTADISAQIVTSCGAAVLQIPNLPGAAPAVIAAVTTVAKAVAKFVDQIKGTTAEFQAMPKFAQGFAVSKAQKVSKSKLKTIHKKLGVLHAKLHPAT